MKKYPLNQVQYYSRFRDMVEDLGEKYGDAPAISWFTRAQKEMGVTYRQFRDDVRHLQEKMVQLGLNGKHIAIVGENCYEWILVCFAANYCGSTAVFVDIEQSDETILQMLTMADTDAIFLSPSYKDICLQYVDDDQEMFLLTGEDEEISNVKSLIAAGKSIWTAGKQNKAIDSTVTGDMTAAIVFTSGTTSQSKAVMLSQEAILTNAADAMANVDIGKVTFTNLPFYHTYGWTCSIMDVLVVGSHTYINGNLRTVFRDLMLSGAQTLFTVPLMLETIHSRIWASAEEQGKAEGLKKLFSLKKLLYSLGIKKSGKTLEEIRKKALGSIELVICGGAHVGLDIMEQFQYMGVTVLQGYGITECAPLVSVNRNKANKLNSVGLISAHTEVKLDDGEILVRGKNLMKGYYNAPQLNEEVMKDGWFCTGDMGEIDKDGFLYIIGRKKNLIVFKNGKKMAPEKLEEKIKKIPLVQDVMVYGAVSGVSTDDVQVAVSIYPDQEKAAGMTSYEILETLQKEIDSINNELPLYQQIQMLNIREQEFSKTALKKIKRHLV
ncbi:MAG: AMP-binding protein [Firmicutes bacterium]|nr:AMP-binding protein [Bacillota bacterium]